MTRGSTGVNGLDAGRFGVESERTEGGEHIRIQGEMDMSVIAKLDREMARAEAGDANKIVLDLDELEFMDASGVRLLLNASERSRRNGGRLRVTRAWAPQVRRMFELTGVGDHLPLAD